MQARGLSARHVLLQQLAFVVVSLSHPNVAVQTQVMFADCFCAPPGITEELLCFKASGRFLFTLAPVGSMLSLHIDLYMLSPGWGAERDALPDRLQV